MDVDSERNTAEADQRDPEFLFAQAQPPKPAVRSLAFASFERIRVDIALTLHLPRREAMTASSRATLTRPHAFFRGAACCRQCGGRRSPPKTSRPENAPGDGRRHKPGRGAAPAPAPSWCPALPAQRR